MRPRFTERKFAFCTAQPLPEHQRVPEGRARLPPADDSTTLVLPFSLSLSLSLSLAILTGLPPASRRDFRWCPTWITRSTANCHVYYISCSSINSTKCCCIATVEKPNHLKPIQQWAGRNYDFVVVNNRHFYSPYIYCGSSAKPTRPLLIFTYLGKFAQTNTRTVAIGGNEDHAGRFKSGLHRSHVVCEASSRPGIRFHASKRRDRDPGCSRQFGLTNASQRTGGGDLSAGDLIGFAHFDPNILTARLK